MPCFRQARSECRRQARDENMASLWSLWARRSAVRALRSESVQISIWVLRELENCFPTRIDSCSRCHVGCILSSFSVDTIGRLVPGRSFRDLNSSLTTPFPLWTQGPTTRTPLYRFHPAWIVWSLKPVHMQPSEEFYKNAFSKLQLLVLTSAFIVNTCWLPLCVFTK